MTGCHWWRHEHADAAASISKTPQIKEEAFRREKDQKRDAAKFEIVWTVFP